MMACSVYPMARSAQRTAVKQWPHQESRRSVIRGELRQQSQVAEVPEYSPDRTQLSIHGVRGAHGLRGGTLTPTSTNFADAFRLLHEYRAERYELPLVEVVNALDP